MPKLKTASDEKHTRPSKKSAKKPKTDPHEQRNKTSSTTTTAAADNETRPIVYDRFSVRAYTAEKPITVAEAKKLLGWQEETETVKFGKGDDGAHHHLIDLKGKKVRCNNNVTNRPITTSNIAALRQDILKGRWRLNGETIIIGKTGLVLNGQHTLIALVLASQLWRAKPDQYQQWWTEEPSIQKLVVFGIDEDDETVNTMDTCKPRSLAEVIFRSELFNHLPAGVRKKVSRITDYAVRLLWHRTGAKDAFTPRRTHAEAIDFIYRHSKILGCVRHIYEENGKDNNLARYISPGTAAGLMYLMATALTEREAEDGSGYSDSQERGEYPDESQCDFTLWDKASEFWVLLASNHKTLQGIRAYIAELTGDGLDSVEARLAVIIKAWNVWTSNKQVTPNALSLAWTEDEEDDGRTILAEHPVLGGIDLGGPV